MRFNQRRRDQSIRNGGKLRQGLRRMRTLEMLESRQLLAGHTFASTPWHNAIYPTDVNRDNKMSPLDALIVINDLAVNGMHAVPPASATPLALAALSAAASTGSSIYPDVNGDNLVSPLDVINVINLLQVDDQVQIHAFATDLAGNPITTITQGSDFRLQIEVQDVRTPPDQFAGVFAAYLNTTYDSAFVSISQNATINFDPFFPIAHTFDVTTAGEVKATGAASDRSSPPGNAVQKLWNVVVHANNPGVATFTPSFDATPGHDVLLYGVNEGIEADAIDFLGGSIQIVATPTISIADVSQNEGSSGPNNYVFTLTLSAPSATQVTVGFNTSDGSAAAPGDYTAQTSTATFAPNVTTALVTIVVNGDNTVEPNETFNVVLSNPSSNAAIGDGTAVGTLVDDDTLPAISVADVTVQNVTSGFTTAVFTVSLSAAAGSPVTVEFATANQTAIDGVDYVAQSGTLTFNPNVTSRTVTISIIGDPNNDDTDTFLLNLSNPSANATLTPGTHATGTILPAVVLPTLSVNSVTKNEGNAGTTEFIFTVSLSNSVTQNQEVTFATANGSATTAGNDYLAATGTITFTPGVLTRLITVAVIGDTDIEGTETFTLNLTPAGSGIANGGVATGTINNDDGIAGVSINDVTITASPNLPVSAVFTVTLSTAVQQPVTVSFATEDNTATAPQDYLTQTGILTFVPGGPLSQLVTVPITAHPVPVDDENFFVNLSSNSQGVFIDDSRGVGTIIAQGVSISSLTLVEGNAGTTNAVFSITLSKPQDHQVTVQFNTADGTATLADSDYTAASGAVTFGIGDTTPKLITIAVTGDTKVELNENFFVNLSNAVGTTVFVGQGTVTVLNDDGQKALVRLQLADAFGVPLPANTVLSPNDNFVLQAFVQDVQASPTGIFQAYTDVIYTTNVAVNGPITFGTSFPNRQLGSTGTPGLLDEVGAFAGLSPPANPGAQQLLFTVPFKVTDVGLITFTPAPATNPGNEILEYQSNEPIPSSAVNYVGASVNSGSNVFSINSVSKAEGNSGQTSVLLTVTRFLPSASAASVSFSTSPGTAAAGQDYVSQSGVLSFAIGETTKTITLIVNGDLTDEPDETFSVNLSNPVGALASQSPGVVTILNDDGPAGISISNATANEGNDLSFVVTLSRSSGQTVTVQFATANSPSGNLATSGVDYQAVSGVLTFAPNVTQQTITVHSLTDILVEPTETFRVQLSNPVNGTVSGSGSGQGSIIDIPPAIISGLVYADLDGDGVQGANEGGIGGVLITATRNSDNSSKSALTNGDGTFSIIGLQPGTYTLHELQPAIHGDGRDTRFGVDTPVSDTFSNIALSSSQHLSGFNFGETGVLAPFMSSLFDRRAFFSTSAITGEYGPPITSFNLAQNEVWISFDAGWQGMKTLSAAFQASQGTASMTLYDSSVHAVAASTPANGGASLPFTTFSSGPMFLKLSGTNPNVRLNIEDTVSVNNVTLIEGNSGTTNFVFTVSLSGQMSQAITVHYATAAGTANAGDDYESKSGILTFAPGVVQQTVTVRVVGDGTVEATEKFYLNLSSPTGINIGQGQGTATIVNDDIGAPGRMFALNATDSAFSSDDDWVTDSMVA